MAVYLFMALIFQVLTKDVPSLTICPIKTGYVGEFLFGSPDLDLNGNALLFRVILQFRRN